MPNNYKILGIPFGSPPHIVKKAFRTLVSIYHPDKPEGDAERFKEIVRAYGELQSKIKEQDLLKKIIWKRKEEEDDRKERVRKNYNKLMRKKSP